MNVFDEFSHIVRMLEERGLRYALVGGIAMAFYTEPRFTRDIEATFVNGKYHKPPPGFAWPYLRYLAPNPERHKQE